jgi:hypothetical protein
MRPFTSIPKFLFLIFLLCAVQQFLQAQDTIKSSPNDSTIVFDSVEKAHPLQAQTNKYASAWGIDLLVSTNGFGAGSFYRHEYSDDFSGFIDFSISEAKDDDEALQRYDYWGNPLPTPGKLSRFLVMPVFVGVQKRLFEDDIIDNFRPYVTAAAGPSMIYVFPYDQEYFSALGKGKPKYTFGGYVGFGAYFGSERSNLLGLNIRYYFIPYPSGLESMAQGSTVVTKNQFGSLSISLSFGTAW